MAHDPVGTDQTLAEWLGQVAGWAMAPLVDVGTRLRRTRLIHAAGQVYAARVDPLAGPYRTLGRRLAGRALVRLSAALGHRRLGDWPDVLGLAVRFHGRRKDGTKPRATDQDLLFVTAASVLDLPFAMVRTRTDDFLANDYHGLASFEVDGAGSGRLRVRWNRHSAAGRTRAERLARNVRTGTAVGILELSTDTDPTWRDVVAITLEQPLDADQHELGFSPFRDGKGVVPTGWLQAARQGAYAAGQHARTRKPHQRG